MKIKLSKIKPSPYQEFEWGEEDIAEAAVSEEAFGVLEKPRVYEENGNYVLIFAHKRVDAARLNGRKTIDCDVVPKPSKADILCQQIIEDEQHKDKPWEYHAQRYVDAIDAIGISKTEDERELWGLQKGTSALSERTGVPQNTIYQAIQSLLSKQRLEQLSARIIDAPQRVIQHATTGARGDDEAAAMAIEKSQGEGLSRSQTRKVAASIAAAPSEAARKKLFEREYSPVIHDPEMIEERAKKRGAHDALYRDPKPKKDEGWQKTPKVKAIIDFYAHATKELKAHKEVSGLRKMSPEARPFIARKVRAYAKRLLAWADELEEGNEN